MEDAIIPNCAEIKPNPQECAFHLPCVDQFRKKILTKFVRAVLSLTYFRNSTALDW